jgi:hypothetical protein
MNGVIFFRPAKSFILSLMLLSLQLCICRSQETTCGDKSLTDIIISEASSSTCMQGQAGLAAQLSTGVYGTGSLAFNFAFQWLGRRFTSFFVNVKSFITFGASSSATSAFSALNPAGIPTLFVGAASGNVLTQLYVGNDAGGRGLRVRFEGSTQASGSPTNIVWEALLKNDGAMELCTGTSMATNYGGLTAVSNGISSSLIATLDLQPSSVKSLMTTCDPCATTNLTTVHVRDSASSTCLQGQAGLAAQLSTGVYGTGSLAFNFAFQWLGRRFTSFFVNVKSFITFGASSSATSAFSALNPAGIPTLFVGAASGNVLTQLYVGNDAGGRGLRVRFEGSTQASGSPTNIVWEALLKNDGAMELCTGTSMATNYGGLTAVSNGISSSLIATLDLQPSSVKSLMTTCDPLGVPSITLSSTYQRTSGVSMTVVFTPAVAVASGSRLVITLAGAGLSVPTNAALAFTQPASGASGSANITGGAIPVLTARLNTTAGAFAAGSSVRFVISSVTTPTLPQPMTSSLLSSVVDGYGVVVTRSNVGEFPQIQVSCSNMTANDIIATDSASSNCMQGQAGLAAQLSTGVYGTGSLAFNFAFQWLGRRFTSFFVNVKSFITFGASSSATSAFSALNPAGIPTLFVGAASGNVLTQLYVGNDAGGRGLRVRFEGSTQASGSPTNIVWEALLKNDGAMELCTGTSMATNYGGLTAVSNGISSSLIATLDLQPSSVKSLMTTCDPLGVPSITLSSTYQRTSGVSMTVVFTPAVAVASGSRLVITLAGAGLSVPTNAALAFTQPASGASGSANITGGAIPVLTARLNTTAGAFAAGSSVRFVISSVTTPTNAQAALSGVSSVLLSDSGGIVAASTTGLLPAIEIPPYGTCEPVVTFSAPVRNTSGVSMTVVFTPAVAVASGSRLVITLAGAGLSVPTNAALAFTQPASGASGSANITGGAIPVLTARLNTTAGAFAAGSSVRFVISSVTTPTNAQAALSGVSSVLLSDSGGIVAASTTGLLPAIGQSTLGTNEPVVTFSAPVRNTSGVSMTVVFTPAVAVASGSRLVITLAGAGLSVPTNAALAFTQPASGASGSANITGGAIPVLTARLNTTAGAFAAGSSVRFVISSVTTPTNAQAALSGVSSVLLSDSGGIVAASTTGLLPAIGQSTLGTNEPVVTFSAPVRNTSGVSMTVVFTPAVAVASGSRLVITLAGAGLSVPTNAALAFTQPASGASGSANITGGAIPVLTARLNTTAGAFAAGSSVRFVISSVTTPTNAQAAVLDVYSAVLSFDETVCSSITGSISSVFGNFGGHPFLVELSSSSLDDNTLRMSFVPTFSVPSGGSLIVSILGSGISLADSRLVSTFSTFSTFFSFFQRPTNLVLTVNISRGHILAGSNISFSFSSVRGICKSTLKSINALTTDSFGATLDLSTNVVIISTSNQPTVQELIIASLNGVVRIPSGLYMGFCNCNSTITSVLPARPFGTAVHLMGAKSVIDCFGTGLRCLTVFDSSIHISGIIFKGGISSSFMSESVLNAALLFFRDQGVSSQSFPMIQKYETLKSPNPTKYQRLLKYRSARKGVLSSVRKNVFHQFLATHSRNASFSDKNVFVMREKVIKSRHGKTANFFKFTHLSSRARSRKLLQFSSSSTSIDPIPENSSGGCVFIQSPHSAITISMSSFVECSSL